MNNNYFTYCLLEGKHVRYIGITSQRPERRLLQHYSDASRKRTDHKTNWIRHCLAEGIQIEIRVIKSGLMRERAEHIEVGLLRLFRKSFRLVNSHEGGASGYAGLSLECKEKHRLSMSQLIRPSEFYERVIPLMIEGRRRIRIANQKPLIEVGVIEFGGEHFNDGQGKIWRIFQRDGEKHLLLEFDGVPAKPQTYGGVLRMLARRLTAKAPRCPVRRG